MRLVTASQMRALDHQTIHGVGVPGVVLMETAGRAVVEVVASLFPSLPGPGPAVPAGVAGRRVVVVAGPGNNGGDGFVVARCLFDRGAQVEVLLAADEAKVAGDARTHFEAMRRAGVTVHALTTEEQLGEAGRFIDAAEVIVDALLGTGAGRRVEGQLAQVIARINAAPGVRVAVDVPSGIDVDRGHSLGAVVQADHTVSFGFAKLGLVTSPGFLHVGRLVVADIGIAERLARGLGVMCELLDEECLVPLRVKREPRSHKGSFGHLLVVAGSRRHPGAALMTAEAAARTGAGLVTVAAPDETAALLAGRVPEISWASIGGEPVDAAAAWLALGPLLDGKRAVAFGPGVPPTAGMRALLEMVLATWERGLVVDADGLNLLAEDARVLERARGQVVLTPHPTEMGRLARLTTEQVQADRVSVASEFAIRFRVVVVLKGARTVIAGPDGRVAINPTGNPGMATGGTGDALTGVIGALLANGMAAFDAAAAGAYLHGRAGDLARDEVGEAGMMTRDLIERLPRARRIRPA